MSEGDEGRVAWVSRISLSPVEIRPSREATRLEESNNTTKRTGRNATGTSPTLTFMPRANIFESKTLELLIKTNSYILDIKYYFSRVY